MTVTVVQAGEVAAPTPSQTIVRAAPSRKAVDLTMSSGRVFTVRKLGPLDRMLASKAIGGDLVLNPLYSSYAMVACSITAVDAQPVAMPSTQSQIEALVNRIGDDWDELNDAMVTSFAPAASDYDPDAVKN